MPLLTLNNTSLCIYWQFFANFAGKQKTTTGETMKKSDSLIIGAFVGPFILTTAVVVFVLLINVITAHLDQLMGKGLSWVVFVKLIAFFGMSLLPLALPLAVLLASLITFGNLGEHNELTAMKSSGVSLLRVLRPIFIFSVLLAIFSFGFSDRIVPWANLNAYSLLWDIKQKVPTFNIKEGVFYGDLPNYTIRVNKKLGEKGEFMKGVMIYNHSTSQGNSDLIVADSGRMYMIKNDRYLVLELYKGKSYHDQSINNVIAGNTSSNERFITNEFNKTQIVFSLEAFDMKETDKNLFAGHRYMHNVVRLWTSIDSMKKATQKYKADGMQALKSSYHYHLRISPDTILKKDTSTRKGTFQVLQTPLPNPKQVANRAVQLATNLQGVLKSRKDYIEIQQKTMREHYVELHKKFVFAWACITMFLIGAPLGAIIKKGGLGLPVLVAIIFFVLWHVLTITGEKWAKEGVMLVEIGMWFPNAILMLIGLYFLRQAKNDSRLFESDFYYVMRDRFLSKMKNPQK